MSADETPPRHLLTRADIEAIPEVRVRHPWNPKSDVSIKRLGPLADLSRLALSIARVPPGKESFVYHRHERDEEFLVILSGRGRAEIGEESFEVGPGDVMAFPAPNGPAHQLANPHEEDLVYLMGGESSGFDMGVFPRLGRRIVFSQTGILALHDEHCEQMTLADFIAE